MNDDEALRQTLKHAVADGQLVFWNSGEPVIDAGDVWDATAPILADALCCFARSRLLQPAQQRMRTE